MTRRQLFARSATAAAAATGAAVGLGLLEQIVKPATAAAPVETSEPLVAYVKPSSTGEIRIQVGHREVTVNDPSLVSGLLAAAR